VNRYRTQVGASRILDAARRDLWLTGVGLIFLATAAVIAWRACLAWLSHRRSRRHSVQAKSILAALPFVVLLLIAGIALVACMAAVLWGSRLAGRPRA
jgi:hypothetical protein